MSEGLVKMGDQFSGLDMGALIGGPLKAACEAQVMLAKATSDFISNVCMKKENDGSLTAQTVAFSFKKTNTNAEGKDVLEDVALNVPLLAVVKVPALCIDAVDVTFDMEVKSSETSKESSDKSGEFDATTGLKIGPFHMDVHVKGAVSSHKESTRASDNSAKYHVEVHASQGELPEGLARVLDIVAGSVAPLPQGYEASKTVA